MKIMFYLVTYKDDLIEILFYDHNYTFCDVLKILNYDLKYLYFVYC